MPIGYTLFKISSEFSPWMYKFSNINENKNELTSIATMVSAWMTPFAVPSRSVPTSALMMPYFAGE